MRRASWELKEIRKKKPRTIHSKGLPKAKENGFLPLIWWTLPRGMKVQNVSHPQTRLTRDETPTTKSGRTDLDQGQRESTRAITINRLSMPVARAAMLKRYAFLFNTGLFL